MLISRWGNLVLFSLPDLTRQSVNPKCCRGWSLGQLSIVLFYGSDRSVSLSFSFLSLFQTCVLSPHDRPEIEYTRQSIFNTDWRESFVSLLARVSSICGLFKPSDQPFQGTLSLEMHFWCLCLECSFSFLFCIRIVKSSCARLAFWSKKHPINYAVFW